MMDIKKDLLLWFKNFLIKNRKVLVLIYHQSLMNNQLNDYTNQLLENLKKEQFILDLKIRVDEGSEFYNNSFKKWLKDNNIEMYSIHNEGKYVVAERFIRTLKTKIYKYMTSISKNVYIGKFDDIVNEYNNTQYRAIKEKTQLTTNNTYIHIIHDFNIKKCLYR